MSARFTHGPAGQRFQRVETWDDLAAAIVLAEQQGAIGTAILFRARLNGGPALLPLARDASASRFKQFVRLTSSQPAIVLVGDDDGLETGPAGWSCIERAIRWPASVVIHAAGAEAEHYELALAAAQICRRLLFIECGSRSAPGWIEAVRRAPQRPNVLVIEARDGVHPLPVDRNGLQ